MDHEDAGAGRGAPSGVWRVRELRLDRIHREVAVRIAGGRVTLADPAEAVVGRLDLAISDGVVDRHVHLGLVDRAALAGSPVTAVVDLGWDPAEIARIAARPPVGVDVRYAGPFHTALGGYPTDRAWAPAAAVREVARAEDAAAAVAEARAGGSGAVKIVLHDGGPLLADDVLAALVDAAHAAGLPAAVHAEGAGQAARAIRAGADVLVHVPWTERLDDATLRESAARDMLWISTLAIHDGTDLATALERPRVRGARRPDRVRHRPRQRRPPGGPERAGGRAARRGRAAGPGAARRRAGQRARRHRARAGERGSAAVVRRRHRR